MYFSFRVYVMFYFKLLLFGVVGHNEVWPRFSVRLSSLQHDASAHDEPKESRN